jgi:hypothetical protein
MSRCARNFTPFGAFDHSFLDHERLFEVQEKTFWISTAVIAPEGPSALHSYAQEHTSVPNAISIPVPSPDEATPHTRS